MQRNARVFAVSLALAFSGWAGDARAADFRPHPVLEAPKAALEDARALEAEGLLLEAAEIELYAGAPKKALETLAGFRARDPAETSRRTRLELDAWIASGDRAKAIAIAEQLAKDESWASHASRQLAYLEFADLRAGLARYGSAVFAAVIAFLVLLGGRELLRVGREDAVIALAACVTIGAALAEAPILLGPIGVLAFALGAIVHAAAASARRTAPGPRGRMLVLSLVILGALAATIAVASQLELAHIAGLLPFS